MKTRLGNSNIEVSALGMGCWPIGNTWTASDGRTPQGYGELKDEDSVRALHRAVDLGVNLFDTANIYGCGHSETVIGRAFADRRDKVVLASKFGYDFDESTGIPGGAGSDEAFIRKALEGSLRRLNTDYIDLYQFHDGGFPVERADEVLETLEKLTAEGKIRSYGWSTDDAARVKAFAKGEHCDSAQSAFNIFTGNRDILNFAENENISILCRSPLAMGLLSDKYDADSIISGKDIRATDTDWLSWFRQGRANPDFIRRRDSVREILRSGGRSLVQGALAWLWGKSDRLIPIPGFKSLSQVEENIRAMEFGPLSADQVSEVEELAGEALGQSA